MKWKNESEKKPFVFGGKVDIWVLGVELEGFSYVRPSH